MISFFKELITRFIRKLSNYQIYWCNFFKLSLTQWFFFNISVTYSVLILNWKIQLIKKIFLFKKYRKRLYLFFKIKVIYTTFDWSNFRANSQFRFLPKNLWADGTRTLIIDKNIFVSWRNKDPVFRYKYICELTEQGFRYKYICELTEQGFRYKYIC